MVMNMERFAIWISNYLYEKKLFQKDKIYEVGFAIEVVLSNLISFGVTVALGFILDTRIEMFLFLILFIGFRSVDDRFHARTFIGCFILTVGSFLAPLLISKIIIFEIQHQFTVQITMLNTIITLLNSEINEQTRKSYICSMLFLNLGIFVLSFFKTRPILIFIGLTSTILVTSTLVENKRNFPDK